MMSPSSTKRIGRSGTQLERWARKGAGARSGGMPSLAAAVHGHAK